MYLLFCISLSVFVLSDHCCKGILSSRNESLERNKYFQEHGVIQPEFKIKAKNERSNKLAYTSVKHSQNGNLIYHSQTIGNLNDICQLRHSTYDVGHQQNPCSVQQCAVDTIVNCMGMSLKHTSSTWFPRNTTVILLDDNDIETLDNCSFSSLTNLLILSVSNNKIKRIEDNAFRGLTKLEILNLESNKLTQRAFPQGIFDPLCRINSLLTMKNKGADSVPGILFRNLRNLKFLTVDAVGEIFNLDTVLTNLTKLILTGNVKTIGHTSFMSFPHTRELIIDGLESLSNFTDTALQPLHNLDILKVNNVYIGVEKSLQILKPLTGRNMTSICFARVYFNSHEGYLSLYNNQGILDVEKTQYLSKICVEHFSLTDSRIFVIQMNTFSRNAFKTCLRSLDLSSNNLIGTKHGIAILLFFQHIEVLNLQNEMRACYVKDSFLTNNRKQNALSSFTTQTTRCLSYESLTRLGAVSRSATVNATLNREILEYRYLFQEKNVLGDVQINQFDILFDNAASSQCPTISPGEHSLLGYFRLYISKSLTRLNARVLIGSGSLKQNLIFMGRNNLRFIDLRDSGITDFIGKILGLDRLQTLMLSGNDVSNLSTTFFDGMCHLSELDVSNCQLGAHFMSNHSARIFQKLLDLKRVDLSSNLLNDLKPGTFAPNKLLEEIDLSKNRFQTIPFDLENTPKLNFLDLQENSLTTLKSDERDKIDNLASQPAGFRLLLSGNILSCGCTIFMFLIWLQTTSAFLDDGRNFTCMNDEGQLSYVSGVTDLEALWRKCWGRTFLSLSLILLCCIIVGFLLTFFVWRNRTFITSAILHILTGYKLKTPEDYPIRVFIGYSEMDFYFPCFVLSKFIEDELHLSTYVYNRDNIPNRDRASSIVDAINASWRIILVVTDNFLCNDDWAMFTTKTAIYGMSSANPARVVVLVLENLQYGLPQDVLSSVHEENLITLTSWEISNDVHRRLRTCL